MVNANIMGKTASKMPCNCSTFYMNLDERDFSCWYCITGKARKYVKWALIMDNVGFRNRIVTGCRVFALLTITIHSSVIIYLLTHDAVLETRGFYILESLRKKFKDNTTDFLLMILNPHLLSAAVMILFNYSSSFHGMEKKIADLWIETLHPVTNEIRAEHQKQLRKIQNILCYLIGPILLFIIEIFLFWLIYATIQEIYDDVPPIYRLAVLIYSGLNGICISFIVIYSLIYYSMVCASIRKKFHEAFDHFSYLIGHLEEINTFKCVQYRHHKFIQMVELADQFFQKYICALYIFLIPMIFICLKKFTQERPNEMKFCTYLYLTIALMFIIYVTAEAGFLSAAAHRPRDIMHELAPLKIPDRQRLQINIFLERINGPQVGLTCLGFFVVTGSTLSSIFSLLVTYLLMYFQFEQQRKGK